MNAPAQTVEPTPAVAPVQSAEEVQTELRRWAFLIGAAVFSTTLSQTAVQLIKLPLQHLLKYDLHITRAAMAGFFALASMAWNFKPFAGILSDSLPLFGTRRRHYLIFSMLFAATLWLAAGLVPRTYNALLFITVAVNVCLVFGSTVAGGLLVEAGQRYGATGRLSSARFVVQNTCLLLAGPIGGFLAARAFGLATAICAAVAFTVVPIAILFLREPPTATRDVAVVRKAGQQLGRIFRSAPLWAAAGMLFLVYVAPGFSTPLYYYQTDTLHFSQQFIGMLGLATGSAGVGAALLYGAFCRRVPLRRLLAIGISLMAVVTLTYLFYGSQRNALMIELGAGMVATLAELPLMDLAARATPRGSEGLGFALMMSVRNGAIALSDIIGSKLADQYHWQFSRLVWLNALTTALCLIVVPFLPNILMNRRDGDVVAAK